MRTRILAILAASLLVQHAFADASYQDRTQITGGSLVGLMKFASAFSRNKAPIDAPQTTIVMVHGKRMARVNQKMVQIIDLDTKTFTDVDTENHRYEVVTFAAFEKRMNDMAKRMQKSNGGGQPASDLQMTYKVQVNNTGASKQVDGMDAKQAVITMEMDATNPSTTQPGAMAMTMTSDTWLASDPAGYDEIRQFNQRLARDLAVNMDTAFANSFLAMRGGSTQGLAQLQSESAKLNGAPVLQIVRLTETASRTSNGASNTAAAPPAPAQQSTDRNQQVNTAFQDAKRDPALGSITGGLGSLTSFIKQRVLKQVAAGAKPVPAPQSAAEGSILEMNIEKTHFSTEPAVVSVFEVPAGYTQANR